MKSFEDMMLEIWLDWQLAGFRLFASWMNYDERLSHASALEARDLCQRLRKVAGEPER